MALLILAVIALFIWAAIEIRSGREAKKDLGLARNNLHKQWHELNKINNENKERSEKICLLESAIMKKDELYSALNNQDNNSLIRVASLIADFQTLQYDLSEKYLKNKKHPAFTEASRIKDLKEKTREIIYQSKLSQYKYEYLFNLFPELELYADSVETLVELNQFKNLGEAAEQLDRTKYYLEKEEYNKLSENERNQLALDRYIKSQRTKWEIGRDYELFIGYEYTKDGWDVEYFGIDKQLSDMGRDLIASKDKTVHIVQCKYWAQHKLIHEKHIAQLYGTAVQYKLSTSSDKNVIPVFVTNISLSDTAKRFANHLGVKIRENKAVSDFPRIKCNISRDEFGNESKIYHLPMDQQYDKTKILNNGEFFAYTVDEATKKGFRRAYRWKLWN